MMALDYFFDILHAILPNALLGLALGFAFLCGTLYERYDWNTYFYFIIRQRFPDIMKKTVGDSLVAPRCRLVGSGPGDPALLTIAARQAIEEADIVITDLLVPSETLKIATGRVVVSRKYKGCASKAQEELLRWTIDALREGMNVVRLKGGDPFLYGRGAEEIEAIRSEGFDVEVIPGISSSLCAPLAAGISVTSRGVADQLLVVTGHGKNDTVPRPIDIYHPSRTTVCLMGVGHAARFMDKLMMESNYPEDVPVAVVERATSIEQRVVRGTVRNIAQIMQQANVRSPATIVIGNVVNHLSQNPVKALPTYQHGSGCVVFRGDPCI